MEKPTMEIVGDKVVIKQPLAGLDLNKDGQKSVALFIGLEGDKAELSEEVMGVMLGKINLGATLGDLIGKKA